MKWFPLNNPGVLEVTGRDAQRYLNARLSNDVLSLGAGQCCRAAALTPQGKIEAIFSVLCKSPEAYLLLSDATNCGDTIAALKRFLVADRVLVVDKSAGYQAAHVVKDEPSPSAVVWPEPGTWTEYPGMLVAPQNRIGAPGVDIFWGVEADSQQRAAYLPSGVPALDESQCLLARIKAGAPRFPDDLGEEVLLLEAGFADAVSFTKGCYAGQEVIERISSSGKVPRKVRSVSLEGDHAQVCRGEKVLTACGGGGVHAGEVLSAAWSPEEKRWYCFVILKNKPEIMLGELWVGARRVEFLGGGFH